MRVGSRGIGRRSGGAAARTGGFAFTGVFDRQQGKGEAAALAGAAALGADAAPVRFHQPLADDEPEAGSCGRAFAASGAGVLAEQMRQLPGRDAPAFVRDRN